MRQLVCHISLIAHIQIISDKNLFCDYFVIIRLRCLHGRVMASNSSYMSGTLEWELSDIPSYVRQLRTAVKSS